MAVTLGNDEQALLDQFLDQILKRYRTGDLDLEDARDDLSHAFAMIAADNAAVIQYMRGYVAPDDD